MSQDSSNQFSRFKKNVKDFLKLDEEMRVLSKARSERSKSKDLLSREIMAYYRNNNIHTIDLNTDDGNEQLELVESKRKPAVNQKFLRTALEKYCKDDQIVDHMIDHILDQRQESETTSFRLKRIQPQKAKKIHQDQETQSKKEEVKKRFAMLTQLALGKQPSFPSPGPPPAKIAEDQTNHQTNHQIKQDIERLAEDIAESVLPSDIPEEETLEDEPVKIEPIKDEPVKIEPTKAEPIKEEVIETDSELSEEETTVDLDSIPIEETGCDLEKPTVNDEEEPPIPSISQHLSKKLNQMTEKEFAGSIPKPQPIIPFSQLETLALQSWKRLDDLTKQKPILMEWLKLQKQKLTLIKERGKCTPADFKKCLIAVDQREKQFPQESPEIEKEKLIIKKYIIRRFQA